MVFPSRDSDYDVRFLYLHPLEWYFSIQKRRNVVESLIATKCDGQQLDRGQLIGPISDFIEREITCYENLKFDYEKSPYPEDKIDQLFINAFAEVWGSDTNAGLLSSRMDPNL